MTQNQLSSMQASLKVSETVENEILIIMRVYFEKPRTTIGWKGLINDPQLDNSFKINDGLRVARKVLRDISEIGFPAGTEFLDLISPQYISDLWLGCNWCKNIRESGS